MGPPLPERAQELPSGLLTFDHGAEVRAREPPAHGRLVDPERFGNLPLRTRLRCAGVSELLLRPVRPKRAHDHVNDRFRVPQQALDLVAGGEAEGDRRGVPQGVVERGHELLQPPSDRGAVLHAPRADQVSDEGVVDGIDSRRE
jgi:hypothetical protein